MADSDSSEEDLSRFKEAVDMDFINVIKQVCHNETNSGKNTKDLKQKSERYLEEATHYNDVKVPQELQQKIGKKISNIINKNIEFVDVQPKKYKRKIRGGVKLFKDSEDFLSCHEAEDTYTESHNKKAKELKKTKASTEEEEEDKLKAVVVSGDYVLSKKEIKCWKSRRKEKLFKYKSNGKGVLEAVE